MKFIPNKAVNRMNSTDVIFGTDQSRLLRRLQRKHGRPSGKSVGEIDRLAGELGDVCANSPMDMAQTLAAMLLALANCLENLKAIPDFPDASALVLLIPHLNRALAMLDEYAKFRSEQSN